MSDTPETAANPSSPENPTSRNLVNDVEQLLADTAALKDRVATLETKVP